MKELSKEKINEIVKINIRKLVKEECSLETAKGIVCKFYSTANLSACQVCLQNEEDLEECKNDYLSLMSKNPALIYSPELERKKLRSKIPLEELDFLGMNCDICHIRENCPLREVNSMCAIDWDEGVIKNSPKDVLRFMLDIQIKRVARARKMEEIDGGMPDENLSKELEKLRIMNDQMIELQSEKLTIKGSLTATHQPGEGGGSLLQSIFGGALKKMDAPSIDVPHEDVTVEDKSDAKSKK